MSNKYSIYPDSDSPEEVIQRAVEHLPITTQNELIILMKTYRNSIMREQEPNHGRLKDSNHIIAKRNNRSTRTNH